MSNKPSVTLTLAGDEKRLLDSFDKAAKGAKSMGESVDSASNKMGGAGGFDKAAKGAEKASKSFGDASESMNKASSNMLAKGAILGLGVATAFSGAFEQADVGGMLAAQMGGGADRAAQLGGIAGKVYGNNFGESLQDVGEALKGVIGNNLVEEDAADADIQKVTEKLLTVAQVVGDTTTNVSRAVKQMLRTGMAESAEEAFDLIVRAQQQGINKSEDLLEVLNEYGTQFRKLGLDGPTALGLMSQAIKGGARDADIAADAFKEFSIRAVDGSKLSMESFKMLGLDGEKMSKQIAQGGEGAKAGLDLVIKKIQDMKDPIKQGQIATGLFGTQWEDLGTAFMEFDVGTAVDSLGNIEGATDSAMTAIGDTPTAKFESFKRSMETSLIDVINVAAPLLMTFGQFLSQNMDVLLPMAGVIATVTAATWLWNAAMSANPIVLITYLVAGLVAGIMILWQRSAAFRDFFIGAWNVVQSVVGAVVDYVVGRWQSFVSIIQGIASTVASVFSGIGEAIKNAFKAAFNFVADVWNNTAGRLAFDIPSWVPFIGGNHFGVPKIPKFHTGRGGIPGAEMLAVVQSNEEISPAGQGGGGDFRLVSSSGSDGAVATMINELIRVGKLKLVRKGA